MKNLSSLHRQGDSITALRVLPCRCRRRCPDILRPTWRANHRPCSHARAAAPARRPCCPPAANDLVVPFACLHVTFLASRRLCSCARRRSWCPAPARVRAAAPATIGPSGGSAEHAKMCSRLRFEGRGARVGLQIG